jgi:TonB family protein
MTFSAQNPLSQKESERIETVPAMQGEEMPVFPGGNVELQKFLKNNIVFPLRCKNDTTFKGCKVYVKFIVNENGKVSDPQIVKGCFKYDACDAEVLRVVSIMPNWIPAQREGKPVKRTFSLPVEFKRKE